MKSWHPVEWIITFCVIVGLVLCVAWVNPSKRKPKTCKEIINHAIAKHVEEYHGPDTYPRQFKLNWDEIDTATDAAIEQAYEETNRSIPYRY